MARPPRSRAAARALVVVAAALLPWLQARAAAAQSRASAPSTSPPPSDTGRPLRRGARVTLNVQDADLLTLLRAVGAITGRRFIVGQVHPIRATIYSPTPVTAAEAYDAFLAALESNGLTVVPMGHFLKVVESTEAAHLTVPVYGGGR